ncbi:hypothetical protein SUGI_0900940 [Cryptomeria japonica]|nr:hypothetical protein SUGI_0900940 [Cryptomeria japonica]
MLSQPSSLVHKTAVGNVERQAKLPPPTQDVNDQLMEIACEPLDPINTLVTDQENEDITLSPFSRFPEDEQLAIEGLLGEEHLVLFGDIANLEANKEEEGIEKLVVNGKWKTKGSKSFKEIRAIDGDVEG